MGKQKAVKKMCIEMLSDIYIFEESLIFILGAFTYNRYNGYNKLEVLNRKFSRSSDKRFVCVQPSNLFC